MSEGFHICMMPSCGAALEGPELFFCRNCWLTIPFKLRRNWTTAMTRKAKRCALKHMLDWCRKECGKGATA